MKKVWVFASESDKNINIAIQKKKWAYKKSQKSHGGITIGDYIFLYSKESNDVMCAGIVKTLPSIGEPIYIWPEENWDYFSFTKIVGTKRVPLEEVKNILGVEGNMSLKCKIRFPNAAADLTARNALQIISRMKR